MHGIIIKSDSDKIQHVINKQDSDPTGFFKRAEKIASKNQMHCRLRRQQFNNIYLKVDN